MLDISEVTEISCDSMERTRSGLMTYDQGQPILLFYRDYLNYSRMRQNSFASEVCLHLDPGFTADKQQVGYFSRTPVSCLQDRLYTPSLFLQCWANTVLLKRVCFTWWSYMFLIPSPRCHAKSMAAHGLVPNSEIITLTNH